jgi:ATP-dependent DNA helicase RecQ
MKVVIVAKTRKSAGACIGAITFDGQSVRLIAADAERNEQAGKEYEIGEVWEVHGAPATSTVPPHIENWIVQRKTRLPLNVDPTSFINLYMPAKVGDFHRLYEGLLQATATGALYITEKSGVPPYSTTFWRPDQPLVIDDGNGKNIRYRYPTPDGGRTVAFVGFQKPLEVIPAGTLLRISLAHWWRPAEKPEQELRCYVQLSGWFSPAIECPIIGSGEGADDGELPPAPTPQALQSLLKKTFGYDTFRPLQIDVINSVLTGHDTLVIMPTGGGKSLCYQLPALTFPGLTVVVSPLISLMQDQVEQLRQANVSAIYLNGMLTYGDYLAGMQAIRAGKVKLLYLSPETLLRAEILLMLEKSKVDCFVIDEAHCISQWGPQFREDYYLLNTVRQRLPKTVCVALTATATLRVQEDIKARLDFRQSNTFRLNMDSKEPRGLKILG